MIQQHSSAFSPFLTLSIVVQSFRLYCQATQLLCLFLLCLKLLQMDKPFALCFQLGLLPSQQKRWLGHTCPIFYQLLLQNVISSLSCLSKNTATMFQLTIQRINRTNMDNPTQRPELCSCHCRSTMPLSTLPLPAKASAHLTHSQRLHAVFHFSDFPGGMGQRKNVLSQRKPAGAVQFSVPCNLHSCLIIWCSRFCCILDICISRSFR